MGLQQEKVIEMLVMGAAHGVKAGFTWGVEKYKDWRERRAGTDNRKPSFMDLSNISDFWKAVEKDQLDDGSFVSIQGQLSKYAPLMIGSPKVKRKAHLAYRRKLQAGTSESKRSEINALLAYTAGQMVWRLDLERRPMMYLGLYHSIVRNSIPVFVDGEYYREHVKGIFEKKGNPHVMEARIAGEVKQFPEFMTDVVSRDHLKGRIKHREFSENGPVFGIFVDGKNTRIEYVDEARYLDGDIWVALEENGEQSFMSRFIDFSSSEDFKEETKNLKMDVKQFQKSHRASRIIFQFDQVYKLFPKHETSSVDAFIKEL